MTTDQRGQFVRLGETKRLPVQIHIDGEAIDCLAGDTLLTAMLLHGRQLRLSEFGDGARAGFCNMGACQDCWISFENGQRCRACTTYVAQGQRVLTRGQAG